MSGTNQWAIHIVSTPTGVKFWPWVPNSNAGDPAHAQVGDIVTWGNDTGQAHQPWPTENNSPTGGPGDQQSRGFGVLLFGPDRCARVVAAAIRHSGPVAGRSARNSAYTGGCGDCVLLLLQKSSERPERTRADHHLLKA